MTKISRTPEQFTLWDQALAAANKLVAQWGDTSTGTFTPEDHEKLARHIATALLRERADEVERIWADTDGECYKMRMEDLTTAIPPELRTEP